MKTRMKRMKKPTSKITLLLSNHKTVLYSRLEMQEKFIWTDCASSWFQFAPGLRCRRLPTSPLLDCQ